ncbi:hypothetical protein [Pseudomonas aeruginosa]|uniref:hypothetical protein n=1 Tax=Pseudomonas aeruginosa TaxID=287 RepID=UPI003D0252ED
MCKIKIAGRTLLGFFAIAAALECYGADYEVVKDNSSEINFYKEKRKSAALYLKKAVSYVEEIKRMKSLPEGPALPAQSRKMNALVDEGEQFGDIFSPLSHCRLAGHNARMFWSVMTGNIATSTPEEGFEEFEEQVRGCKGQLVKEPEAITTIRTSVDKGIPFKGCLEVIQLRREGESDFREWTCPTSVLPKK